MSRVKIYMAYGWAVAATPLLLATFMGMPPLARNLVVFTGLHVHPLYTGGEVVQTIGHGAYQTWIHRPVFDGLIGERKHGYVQVKWQPIDGNLPDVIDEPIDVDADGTADFKVHLDTNTGTAQLLRDGASAGGQNSGAGPLLIPDLRSVEVLKVENARIIRVKLTKVVRR